MASPMLTMGTPEMIAEFNCWNWLSWRGRARSWKVTIRVESETSWPLWLFT